MNKTITVTTEATINGSVLTINHPGLIIWVVGDAVHHIISKTFELEEPRT